MVFTVAPGGASISFAPESMVFVPGSGSGFQLTAGGITSMTAYAQNHHGLGNWSLTASVQNSALEPLPLPPDGTSNLIMLTVELTGPGSISASGGKVTLVNQQGYTQGAKNLAVVNIPNVKVEYSWTLNYEATVVADGTLPTGSHVFYVLYTLTGPI